jgi:hypothetical protein
MPVHNVRNAFILSPFTFYAASFLNMPERRDAAPSLHLQHPAHVDSMNPFRLNQSPFLSWEEGIKTSSHLQPKNVSKNVSKMMGDALNKA